MYNKEYKDVKMLQVLNETPGNVHQVLDQSMAFNRSNKKQEIVFKKDKATLHVISKKM